MKYRLLLLLCLVTSFTASAQKKPSRVIAFFTAKNDLAHISFVHEANRWFDSLCRKNNMIYDSTNDWSRLTSLSDERYSLVLFLDTRPELPEQRTAFENYMRNGGAWMGFHFAAFALTPSTYPDNWHWYQHEFIGCGEYQGNTWRPTSAVLKVEATRHPVTGRLEKKIIAAPNEWYSWQNDLRQNPDIQILLSVDSSSFPLGTGPKPHEIWQSGYYPVVWTNNKFRMVYFNMGHNDMDYEHGTNAQLSSTFGSAAQNQLFVNAFYWLTRNRS
jgi:hypothetical protein